VLAMLAHQGALCVGLRVVRLLPSPALCAVAWVWAGPDGTGKQARRSNWKAEFVRLLAPVTWRLAPGPAGTRPPLPQDIQSARR
jgi:hypothetical protein